MRVAIIVALAGSFMATPVFAAPIFVAFDVTATGTRFTSFRVPAGQEPPGATCGNNNSPFSDCSQTTAETRNFSFAQDFNFTNGVAAYSFGRLDLMGVTSFTLTQVNGGFVMSGFSYSFNDMSPTRPYGTLILLSAPTQVIGLPEPATWGLLLTGFGAIGATLRRRQVSVDYALA